MTDIKVLYIRNFVITWYNTQNNSYIINGEPNQILITFNLLLVCQWHYWNNYTITSHKQGFVKGEEFFSFCDLTSSFMVSFTDKELTTTRFLQLFIGCKIFLYLLLIGWAISVCDLVSKKEIQRQKSQCDWQNSSPFTNPWSQAKQLGRDVPSLCTDTALCQRNVECT